MNTCRDCLHYDVCDYVSFVGKICKDFKNRMNWVEQKHGKWIDHFVRDWRYSECGEKIKKVRNVDGYCYDDKPNYCPNCGTKMDLEE